MAMVQVDITGIPFEEDSFDVIICNHVLEHIEQDRKAMQELFRVLKPGGWAMLQVPLDGRIVTYEDHTIVQPEERERFFGQHDHVRRYGLDYKEKLEKVGFEVKVDQFVKEFSPEQIYRYGLKANEDLYVCSKGMTS